MSKFELEMPKMGESITEGTIINWLVNEGDSFEEGDIILEVATDKVDNEVPAPASGTIVELLFQAQDVVEVGTTLAILEVSETATVKPNNTSVSEEKKQVKKEPKKKNPIQVQPASAKNFSVSNSNHFFSPLILAK